MALSSPAKGGVTKRFGRQSNGSFHYGTDRGWGNGAGVYAMLPGTVVEAAFLSDYGNVIRLLHGRDILGRVIESRYCHLKTGLNLVERGAEVAQGEQIATMGSTGSLTDQVHLHSELWIDDIRVDETAHSPVLQEPETPITNQKEKTLAYLLYNPSSAHPDRRGWWVPGFPIMILTTAEAVVAAALQKQMKRVSSTTADSDVTTQVTDTMWDFINANAAPSGSGGAGGFTATDRATLEAIPSGPELAQVLTVQTGDINAHTTAAVNGLTLSAS